MKRALVVDDGSFMRNLIKGMLTRNNFEVVGEAENGIEASRIYDRFKPDIVTMDITMPLMDGIESLTNILRNHPSANIIIISAMGQEQIIKEAISIGAKGFVVKPFDEETLITVIDDAMG